MEGESKRINLSKNLKAQFDSLKDEIASFKNEYSAALEDVAKKAIGEDQLNELNKNLDSKINTIKGSIGDLKKEIESIDGAKISALSKSMSELERTANNLSKVFERVDTLINSPIKSDIKINKNDKDTISELENLRDILEKLHSLTDQNNTDIFGFSSMKGKELVAEANKAIRSYSDWKEELEYLNEDYLNGAISQDKFNAKLAIANAQLAIAAQKILDVNSAMEEYNDKTKSKVKLNIDNIFSKEGEGSIVDQAFDLTGSADYFQKTYDEAKKYVDALDGLKQEAKEKVQTVATNLFAVKNGKIYVGVELQAAIKPLQDKLVPIIDSIQSFANKKPISVPITFTSNNGEGKTKKEIREQLKNAVKTEDSTTVKNLGFNLAAELQKEVVAAKQVANGSIAEIKGLIKDAKLILYPAVKITEEEFEKLQGKLSKKKLSITPSFELTKDTNDALISQVQKSLQKTIKINPTLDLKDKDKLDFANLFKSDDPQKLHDYEEALLSLSNAVSKVGKRRGRIPMFSTIMDFKLTEQQVRFTTGMALSLIALSDAVDLLPTKELPFLKQLIKISGVSKAEAGNVENLGTKLENINQQLGVASDKSKAYLETLLEIRNTTTESFQGLARFSEVFRTLNTYFSELPKGTKAYLNSLKDIIQRTEELKNLATILQSTKAQIDSVDRMTAKNKNVNEYKSIKDNLTTILALQRQLGKVTSKEEKADISSQIEALEKENAIYEKTIAKNGSPNQKLQQKNEILQRSIELLREQQKIERQTSEYNAIKNNIKEEIQLRGQLNKLIGNDDATKKSIADINQRISALHKSSAEHQAVIKEEDLASEALINQNRELAKNISLLQQQGREAKSSNYYETIRKNISEEIVLQRQLNKLIGSDSATQQSIADIKQRIDALHSSSASCQKLIKDEGLYDEALTLQNVELAKNLNLLRQQGQANKQSNYYGAIAKNINEEIALQKQLSKLVGNDDITQQSIANINQKISALHDSSSAYQKRIKEEGLYDEALMKQNVELAKNISLIQQQGNANRQSSYYGAIAKNINEEITLQKQLSKLVGSDEATKQSIDDINKKISALHESSSAYQKLIKDEGLYSSALVTQNAELAKNITLIQQQGQKNKQEHYYNKIYDDLKEIGKLEKQIWETNDNKTASENKARQLSLKAEIAEYEKLIASSGLYNKELERRNDIAKIDNNILTQKQVEAQREKELKKAEKERKENATDAYNEIIDKLGQIRDIYNQIGKISDPLKIKEKRDEINRLTDDVETLKLLLEETKGNTGSVRRGIGKAERSVETAREKQEETQLKNNLKEVEKAYSDLEKALKSYYSAYDKLRNGRNVAENTTLLESSYSEIERIVGTLNTYEEKGLTTRERINDTISVRLDKEKDILYYENDSYNFLSNQLKEYERITGQSQEYSDKIKEARNELNKIDSILNSQTAGILSKDDLNGLAEARNRVISLIAEIKEMRSVPSGMFRDRHDIEKYLSGLQGIVTESIRVKQFGNQVTASYATMSGEIHTCTYALRENAGAFELVNEKVGRMDGLYGLIQLLGSTKDQLLRYFSLGMMVRRLWGEFQKGFEVVKELDKQFTEMRKVSDETITSLKNYVKEAYNVARVTGSTATTILSSTADYMRLGKTLNEAAELAKNTTILMNVSEFESVNEATDALISMTQAYRDLDSLDIIDKLNNVGNKFSISTSDLAQSLQRSAGTLKIAGNDLNEAIALTTAGNAILQDPLKVAAGLRTISLRITGTATAKKELEELGEDVDDFVITTTSKLNEKVKGLTKTATKAAGVSLLDAKGNYRSTYEILQDIADVWKEIKEEDATSGENRQNALLELLAGKNRSNVLASILDDANLLKKVYSTVQNSSGSAMKEQEKYMESIEGRLNVLTTQSQEFWATFINSDFIKSGISLLTELIKVLTKAIEIMGSFTSSSILIGGIVGAKGIDLLKVILDIKNALYGKTGISFIEKVFNSVGKASITKTAGDSVLTNGFISVKKLKESKKAISDVAKATSNLGDETSNAAEKTSLLSGRFVGMIKAVGVIAIVATAIKAASIIIDNMYKSTEEISTSIEEQERQLEDLQGEYDKLNAKRTDNTITAAEAIRLKQLEEENGLLQQQIDKVNDLKKELVSAKYKQGLFAGFDEGTYQKQYSDLRSLIDESRQTLEDISYGDETGESLLYNPDGYIDNLIKEFSFRRSDIAKVISDIKDDIASGILDEKELKNAQEYLDLYTDAVEKYADVILYKANKSGATKEDWNTYLYDLAPMLKARYYDWENEVFDFANFVDDFGGLWSSLTDAGYGITSFYDAIGVGNRTVTDADNAIVSLKDSFESLNSEMQQVASTADDVEEAFDKATSSIDSLKEAQEKLKSGELTSADVLELTKKSPKLAASIDWNDVNFGNLDEAITGEINRIREEEISALEDRQSQLEELLNPSEVSDELRKFYEEYQKALDDLEAHNASKDETLFGNVDSSIRTTQSNVQEVGNVKVAVVPSLIVGNSEMPLNEVTVSNYLKEIISKATKDGEVDLGELLKLDAQGIYDNDYQGVIKNLIVAVGDAAEDTASKFNTSASYYEKYNALLKACGGDTEALTQLSVLLGSSVEELTTEYEKNSTWLEYLKGVMSGGVKTLGELRTEYDDTTGKIKTLDDAVSKLLSKEMTDADVIDLMREFKELAQFDDIDLNDKVNFGNLLQHLMELRNTLPTPLIEALKKLREELAMTASPETLAEIDTLIAGLERAVSFESTGADAFTQAITDSLSRTNDTVQSTLSYFEDLGKLQEAIADGFVMDAEKAWELAQMFPELSKGIMEYGEVGDGLVELNEEIVNGLLEGGDTAIETTIKQLEAEKALVEGKRDAAQAVLKIATDALEKQDAASVKEAIAEVERYKEAANEKIDIEEQVSVAVAQSDQNQIDNHKIVSDFVGKVAGNISNNMYEAARSSAQSISDASGKMQQSLSNIVDAAKGAWSAVKSIGKTTFEGFKSVIGGAGSAISKWFGGSGLSIGGNDAYITGVDNMHRLAGVGLDQIQIDSKLADMIADLKMDLDNYDAAISALDGQITTLRNLQGNAADRIKKSGKDSGSGGSGGGGGGGGGEGSGAAEEQFSETFDWIERAIEMIQKAVERLSKAAGDVYIKFSKRNKALLAEMDKVREEIALQQEAYITYMSIAESVELSEEYKTKVREGLLQIEEVEDEELANKIGLYKEWYDKATQCKDAIQDLEINLGDLAKQKFDNVSKEFEDAMSIIEHRANMVNKAMDKASERGFITSVQYYQALTKYENENLTNLKDKREALIEALADGVKSGAVEEGSEAWYEMQNSINSVTEAIEDSEKALISYDNSIRDVYWDIFDRTRTTVAEVTEEVEFLMGLLDNNPMFNGGDITKEGQAAYGLHAVSYQVYMEEAEAYAKEIQEINKQLATDPYDTVLIDRRKELIKLQRDMINNAEDEKEAMKKLTEDGIKSFLDAMKESIDAYKELMSDWKDNYTFQKNIDEQTAAIARLQKQLNAYSGDDSESGRLNSQKTMNSLRDAQEKLQEDQRDHYISETEKILDNLYDEAESALNERLDHFEELLTTIFDGINANADTIGDTLRETVAEVNTSLSETMDEIWGKNSAASTAVTDAIAKYGEKVGTLPNNVTDSISTIEKYVKALLKAADATAAAELQKQEEDAKKTTVTTAVANQKSKVAANTSNHNVNTAVATGTKAKMTNTAVSSSGGSSSASTSGSGANSTSGSGSKGGDFFVYKKYTDKSNLNLAQSIVDRLRYNDIDNSMANRAKYYEGMGLGSASSYVGSYSQNVAMLQWMKEHGYRRGLMKSNRNHWAMTQEDGLEVINSPKLGMLTPIGKGDTVFTADQTKALWTLSKDFANRVSKPDYNNGNTSTSNVFNLNIGIERVQDYNDFLRQLQGDNRFEKLVKACSIDQLNGANRVSKRRINI